MYCYNTMLVLHLIRFPEMDHDKKLNHIFLGCESDSECKKLGFYACVEGSCVGKYPNITHLCLIHLSILYPNIIITYNRETIIPIQIVQIVGL